jgi:hypothetical protein
MSEKLAGKEECNAHMKVDSDEEHHEVKEQDMDSHEYKSPMRVQFKNKNGLLESKKRDYFGRDVSPLSNNLTQHINLVNSCKRDSKRVFHLSSPKSSNKIIIVSPNQNDEQN